MYLAIMALRDRIDDTLLEDRKRRWMSDSQNSLREFYKTDVIPMSESLTKTLKELQQELIEEVQEMLIIFESMEPKVFSIWKVFEGNTRDLDSFGEETDKTTDLHQNLLKIMLTERGDGVASIKRSRLDLRSDGVRDYSRPSQEGYRNAIELPEGAKKYHSFTSILLSLRDQAINWLDRLPAGSILTWDDLTTRFLAQIFLPGRTDKLQKDILMFQKYHDESLCNPWTHFKHLHQKVPHHGLDLWLQVQIFYDHVDYTTQMAIDYAAGGRLRKLRPEEAWETIEDLAKY
ncbi:zinc finger, CCHC-type containing protein [Tanacetum coccineum]